VGLTDDRAAAAVCPEVDVQLNGNECLPPGRVTLAFAAIDQCDRVTIR
jgi:hypothetical protein